MIGTLDLCLLVQPVLLDLGLEVSAETFFADGDLALTVPELPFARRIHGEADLARLALGLEH